VDKQMLECLRREVIGVSGGPARRAETLDHDTVQRRGRHTLAGQPTTEMSDKTHLLTGRVRSETNRTSSAAKAGANGSSGPDIRTRDGSAIRDLLSSNNEEREAWRRSSQSGGRDYAEQTTPLTSSANTTSSA
jgi:hypothetical protein